MSAYYDDPDEYWGEDDTVEAEYLEDVLDEETLNYVDSVLIVDENYETVNAKEVDEKGEIARYLCKCKGGVNAGKIHVIECYIKEDDKYCWFDSDSILNKEGVDSLYKACDPKNDKKLYGIYKALYDNRNFIGIGRVYMFACKNGFRFRIFTHGYSHYCEFEFIYNIYTQKIENVSFDPKVSNQWIIEKFPDFIDYVLEMDELCRNILEKGDQNIQHTLRMHILKKQSLNSDLANIIDIL